MAFCVGSILIAWRRVHKPSTPRWRQGALRKQGSFSRSTKCRANLLCGASFDEPAESQNFRRIYEGVAIGNARHRLRLTLSVPAVRTTLFVSGRVNANSLVGST